MMKFIYSLLGMLFLTTTLTAADWQTTEATFQGAGISFKMPGVPEAKTTDEGFQFWKVEADGNCYWVGIKPHTCTRLFTSARNKVCNYFPLLTSILPEGSRVGLIEPFDAKDAVLHVSFKDPSDSLYYTSFYTNDTIVIGLISKGNPSLHQKFIESFTFLK